AVDEARRMGHHYIGTEHLLLGLTRQSEGVAIDILKRCNVSPENVRRQTRRVLQESPVASSFPPPPASAAPGNIPGVIRRTVALMGQEVSAAKVMEFTILKILEMIAAEKLTLEQASELLTALQPGLFLLPGEQTELVALFKKAPENRRLRLMVTDKESGAM